jgi:two-component system sensor kinase FixL
MARLDNLPGKAPAVVITAHDIGQREDRERLLANDESLLRSILDTVPDALIVIGRDGHIQSFSKTAEAMFGYREAEVLGRNVNMLMPTPHSEAHDGFIKRYMQTGEKRIIGVGRVVEAVRSDGTVFPIDLSVGEAQAGNHLAFTGFIRDISDRIAAENALNKVQAALAHASRVTAVGTLASALAHELNQPLTAIANYVSAGRDIVASETPDSREMILEAFEEAAKEAHRAGEIVNRMRSFMANGEVEMRNLTLGKLINDATTLGLVGAKERGVEWWIDIEPDIGDVLADQVQIQQVMVNLMRNAIEAMEHSAIKHLIVRARAHSEKRVEISIIDSGPGIVPEVQKTLFQPFTSTKVHGMGLGLSICRTIIEAHGGRLSMETGDEGGTIFRFTLMRASRECDYAN